MSIKNISEYIENHSKIILSFGDWPSFHDSEISRVLLERDEGQPLTGPNLTINVRIFGNWNEAEIVFKFFNVTDLRLSGFDHQNSILDIEASRCGGLITTTFKVFFRPVSSFECLFSCERICLLDVIKN